MLRSQKISPTQPAVTFPVTAGQEGDEVDALLGKLLAVQSLALAASGGTATTTTPAYTEVTAANSSATITAGKKSVFIQPETGGTYKVSVGGVMFQDRLAADKTFTTPLALQAELGTTLAQVIVTRVAGVTQIFSTVAA